MRRHCSRRHLAGDDNGDGDGDVNSWPTYFQFVNAKQDDGHAHNRAKTAYKLKLLQ